MVELTAKEQVARSRTCLALDVSAADEAIDLARQLSDYIGSFKVGKELHTAVCNQGIPIVGRIYETNNYKEPNVFLDLKFHDTPNTVYKASMNAAVPGVLMFNLHISGGEEMCKKAKDGAQEGALKNNIKRPYVIGVTELTSLDDKDLSEQGITIPYNDLVRRRTELAVKWGLDGVVCPANKAGALEIEFGSGLHYVTPGIEWAGISREGQKQLYTPDNAVQDCTNSTLVLGGAILKAKDKRTTAYDILQAMAARL